jgi:hypothetical protein
MLQRIAALEEAMAKLRTPPATMGHNGPPEAIEEEPLSSEDLVAITNAVALFRSQPPATVIHRGEVVTAGTRLQSTAEKLGKWLAEKGDVFASEFAKSAGAQAAKWAVPVVLLATIRDRLLEVVDAVVRWLQALPPS